jgi:hypothetical protein
MNIFFERPSPTRLIEQNTKAMTDLSIESLVSLRNQLYPEQITFVDKDDDARIYQLEDIQAWGKEVELLFTKTINAPDTPVKYWFEEKSSVENFTSEHDALISAFERYMVNN